MFAACGGIYAERHDVLCAAAPAGARRAARRRSAARAACTRSAICARGPAGKSRCAAAADARHHRVADQPLLASRRSGATGWCWASAASGRRRSRPASRCSREVLERAAAASVRPAAQRAAAGNWLAGTSERTCSRPAILQFRESGRTAAADRGRSAGDGVTAADSQFDYVIVGAGSAGCVLANRLTAERAPPRAAARGGRQRPAPLAAAYRSATASRSTIRASTGCTGPSPSRRSTAAAATGRAARCSAAPARSTPWCSCAASPADFDDWAGARQSGLGLGRRAALLPHARGYSRAADPWRGADGPMPVSDVAPICTRCARRICAPASRSGCGDPPTSTAPVQEGVGLYRDHDARRAAHVGGPRLPAIRRRTDRTCSVETACAGDRILFEGTRATGVDYRRNGAQETASARREVILCGRRHRFAAAPAAFRRRPRRAPASRTASRSCWRLPAVGRNLQDHLCIDHLYRSRVPTLNEELRPWRGQLRAGLRYLLRRRGPLALSVNQGGGFVRSRPELVAPEPAALLLAAQLHPGAARASVR